MIVRGHGGQEFELEWGQIYPLFDSVRHEGRTYTHARPVCPVEDPWRVMLELFEQDYEPTTCEHGYVVMHPVKDASLDEQICNGMPPRPPRTYMGQESLATYLKDLPRYDPRRDPSTFEGAFTLLAEALHDSRKAAQRERERP